MRTLAGNYQMLFRYPAWLLPWKNRSGWQLISHKYLRLGGPLYLTGCLADSLALASASPFFRFGSRFNTSVTKRVQNMGDKLAKDLRFCECSGCHGKKPKKWTNESNL